MKYVLNYVRSIWQDLSLVFVAFIAGQTEDGKGRLIKLTDKRRFSVRQKAEIEGLTFAKKWIDDGKPDLSPVVEIERAGLQSR